MGSINGYFLMQASVLFKYWRAKIKSSKLICSRASYIFNIFDLLERALTWWQKFKIYHDRSESKFFLVFRLLYISLSPRTGMVFHLLNFESIFLTRLIFFGRISEHAQCVSVKLPGSSHLSFTFAVFFRKTFNLNIVLAVSVFWFDFVKQRRESFYH